MRKPITPHVHGMLDYAIGAGLLFLPAAIGLNKKAVRSYQAIGTAILSVNSLTDTSTGIKRVLTMKSHQKADASLLASVMLSTLTPTFRKERKEMIFHAAFLAITTAQYMMTDYDYDNLESLTDETM